MSISYNIKKEAITDSVDIPGSQISVFLLQKLLAQKLKVKEHELVLTNVYTGFKLNPMEIIKDKATINVEKLCKSDTKLNISGIVSNEELAEMGRSGRFFMIKSSNEENIQKAREFSVWATTYSNQDKLRSALLYSQHVFLLFATNRSYEIKGLARMEKEPSKTAEKAFWSGVNNIRLGGNFQIRWVRKQPLTSLQIEKAMGTQFRDRVMRFSDGEQVDGELAQKLILLFQLPTEPYYAVKQEEVQIKPITEPVKKILGLGQISGIKKQQNPFPFPFPIPPPLSNTTFSIIPAIIPSILPSKSPQQQVKVSSQVKPYKQQKQQQHKKKEKKNHKDRSQSSSSSSSSSSSRSSSSDSSSSSSSRSSSRSKKQKIIKKKDRKEKKTKRTKDSKRKQRNKSKQSRRKSQKRGKKRDKKEKKDKKNKRRDGHK